MGQLGRRGCFQHEAALSLSRHRCHVPRASYIRLPPDDPPPEGVRLCRQERLVAANLPGQVRRVSSETFRDKPREQRATGRSEHGGAGASRSEHSAVCRLPPAARRFLRLLAGPRACLRHGALEAVAGAGADDECNACAQTSTAHIALLHLETTLAKASTRSSQALRGSTRLLALVTMIRDIVHCEMVGRQAQTTWRRA